MTITFPQTPSLNSSAQCWSILLCCLLVPSLLASQTLLAYFSPFLLANHPRSKHTSSMRKQSRIPLYLDLISSLSHQTDIFLHRPRDRNSVLILHLLRVFSSRVTGVVLFSSATMPWSLNGMEPPVNHRHGDLTCILRYYWCSA